MPGRHCAVDDLGNCDVEDFLPENRFIYPPQGISLMPNPLQEVPEVEASKNSDSLAGSANEKFSRESNSADTNSNLLNAVQNADNILRGNDSNAFQLIDNGKIVAQSRLAKDCENIDTSKAGPTVESGAAMNSMEKDYRNIDKSHAYPTMESGFVTNSLEKDCRNVDDSMAAPSADNDAATNRLGIDIRTLKNAMPYEAIDADAARQRMEEDYRNVDQSMAVPAVENDAASYRTED